MSIFEANSNRKKHVMDKADEQDNIFSGDINTNMQVDSRESDLSQNVLNPVNPAVLCLFRIALLRLKVGGRLVFWLPSEALATEFVIRDRLRTMETDLQTSRLVYISNNELQTDLNHIDYRDTYLKFERASRQELHGALWRWLVVYRKEKSDREK